MAIGRQRRQSSLIDTGMYKGLPSRSHRSTVDIINERMDSAGLPGRPHRQPTQNIPEDRAGGLLPATGFNTGDGDANASMYVSDPGKKKQYVTPHFKLRRPHPLVAGWFENPDNPGTYSQWKPGEARVQSEIILRENTTRIIPTHGPTTVKAVRELNEHIAMQEHLPGGGIEYSEIYNDKVLYNFTVPQSELMSGNFDPNEAVRNRTPKLPYQPYQPANRKPTPPGVDPVTGLPLYRGMTGALPGAPIDPMTLTKLRRIRAGETAKSFTRSTYEKGMDAALEEKRAARRRKAEDEAMEKARKAQTR